MLSQGQPGQFWCHRRSSPRCGEVQRLLLKNKVCVQLSEELLEQLLPMKRVTSS